MKIKVFVHQHQYDPKQIEIFGYDMSSVGYALIGTVDADFEPPVGYDAIASKIEMLQKSLVKMECEHDVKVANIKEQIQNLLCLENKPSSAV